MANIRSKQDFIIFLLLIIATLFLIKFQLYDVEQPSMGLGISHSFLEDVDKYCNQDHDIDGEENDLGNFFLIRDPRNRLKKLNHFRLKFEKIQKIRI